MAYFFIGFIFLFGLIFGSFLDCLIYRLHEGKRLGGRSFCPDCQKQIDWHDNIPLLSYLLLWGRCRHCRKRISWEHPLVELSVGLLFVLAFLAEYKTALSSGYGNLMFDFFNWHYLIFLLRDFFVVFVMVMIFLYDLKWYLILDIITLPAAIVILIFDAFMMFYGPANNISFINWQNLAISVIIGIGFFLLQFLVSRGKWIGGGDIRLGFLMGLILGWPNILLGIMLAYVLGSVVGIYLLLAKKKEWSSKMPLGVFLSTATVVILLWGNQILNWYLGLL